MLPPLRPYCEQPLGIFGVVGCDGVALAALSALRSSITTTSLSGAGRRQHLVDIGKEGAPRRGRQPRSDDKVAEPGAAGGYLLVGRRVPQLGDRDVRLGRHQHAHPFTMHR
jgi:hypothetical protein